MKRLFVLALVLSAVSLSFGCAGLLRVGGPTNAGPGSLYTAATFASYDSTSTAYKLERKDFDVLGPVSAEVQTKSILGWIATGDGGWNALLSKAKQEKGADDVIDVRVDTEWVDIFGIISTVNTRLYGIAVKWK